MKRFQAWAELTDGTIVGPVRIGLEQRLALDKYRRIVGWTEDDGAQIDLYLAWHALHKAELIKCDFAELNAYVFDIGTEPVTESAPAAGDPTQTAA